MKRWKPLLLAALAACLTFTDFAGAHILRVEDDSYVSLPQMIEDLKAVPLVFIGELHDRPGHHRAQLQVIRALHEAGVDVTIALEMVRSDNQHALDRWVAGEMPESEFRNVFNAYWSFWPQYREIFLYARREKIPMIGLNIPREITQQVARSGFSSLSPQQLGELPGVRCDVDIKYQEFIRRSLGVHVHNGGQFLHFCEAQVLWDNVMADTLLAYHARHPQGTIVILAGSGHAWKYGIPEQVRRRADLGFRVLLPEVPGRIERGGITPTEADYLMLGVDEAPLH